ncbi:MAG TPA: hypothetical protein DIC23_06675, partial [Planctomycetaceae bacterium]|nr:hypothetical protein [Planctomycetaceae bacterium]
MSKVDDLRRGGTISVDAPRESEGEAVMMRVGLFVWMGVVVVLGGNGLLSREDVAAEEPAQRGAMQTLSQRARAVTQVIAHRGSSEDRP